MKKQNRDLRFMQMAALVASWSKDRSTRMGAVVAGIHDEVLAVGFNGFARKIDDEVEARHQRPAKYLWTEHAERNAIYNAGRVGAILLDSTMYLHGRLFPCADCARAIIQSGITEVVVHPDCDMSDASWGENTGTANEMLLEAGVNIRLSGAPAQHLLIAEVVHD